MRKSAPGIRPVSQESINVLIPEMPVNSRLVGTTNGDFVNRLMRKYAYIRSMGRWQSLVWLKFKKNNSIPGQSLFLQRLNHYQLWLDLYYTNVKQGENTLQLFLLPRIQLQQVSERQKERDESVTQTVRTLLINNGDLVKPEIKRIDRIKMKYISQLVPVTFVTPNLFKGIESGGMSNDREPVTQILYDHYVESNRKKVQNLNLRILNWEQNIQSRFFGKEYAFMINTLPIIRFSTIMERYRQDKHIIQPVNPEEAAQPLWEQKRRADLVKNNTQYFMKLANHFRNTNPHQLPISPSRVIKMDFAWTDKRYWHFLSDTHQIKELISNSSLRHNQISVIQNFEDSLLEKFISVGSPDLSSGETGKEVLLLPKLMKKEYFKFLEIPVRSWLQPELGNNRISNYWSNNIRYPKIQLQNQNSRNILDNSYGILHIQELASQNVANYLPTLNTYVWFNRSRPGMEQVERFDNLRQSITENNLKIIQRQVIIYLPVLENRIYKSNHGDYQSNSSVHQPKDFLISAMGKETDTRRIDHSVLSSFLKKKQMYLSAKVNNVIRLSEIKILNQTPEQIYQKYMMVKPVEISREFSNHAYEKLGMLENSMINRLDKLENPKPISNPAKIQLSQSLPNQNELNPNEESTITERIIGKDERLNVIHYQTHINQVNHYNRFSETMFGKHRPVPSNKALKLVLQPVNFENRVNRPEGYLTNHSTDLLPVQTGLGSSQLDTASVHGLTIARQKLTAISPEPDLTLRKHEDKVKQPENQIESQDAAVNVMKTITNPENNYVEPVGIRTTLKDNPAELNQIAERVLKMIEKRISIEKDRRGLL